MNILNNTNSKIKLLNTLLKKLPILNLGMESSGIIT